MLESVCGWSRPVDWGNAPSWAAVVVATVVGAFTIANVMLARRAYVDGAWDRKVRIARLVWATKGHALGYSEGKSFRPNRSLFPPSLPEYGAPSTFFEQRQDPDSGEVSYVTARPFSLVKVDVTNNSDEPIGNVSITLRYRDKPLNYAPTAFRVVPPGETKSVQVFADVQYDRKVLNAMRVELRFRDSAGHSWRRTGSQPPVPLPKPKRVRFPKLIAWKNRRVMRVRSLLNRTRDK